jgi:hypothetical protein
MIKTCDDCGSQFDIFKEGYGHQFFVVCGKCWAVQKQSAAKQVAYLRNS